MAKSFENLREKMAPERRTRNQLRTELALFEMSLAEIRQHREQIDSTLAADLVVDEAVNPRGLPNDMLLSTLISFISEMGGTLKLVAQFPDEEIVINQFETSVPQV